VLTRVLEKLRAQSDISVAPTGAWNSRRPPRANEASARAKHPMETGERPVLARLRRRFASDYARNRCVAPR
jgi:hypothetical protein